MDEESVRSRVIEWLNRNKYSRQLHIRAGHERGPDIQVMHNTSNTYFIVEAKGDPYKKAKYAAQARYLNFSHCLGQILQRMKYQNARYGIAFPESYLAFVRDLPWKVCKNLSLEIFLVTKGNVRLLRWADLRGMSRSRRP